MDSTTLDSKVLQLTAFRAALAGLPKPELLALCACANVTISNADADAVVEAIASDLEATAASEARVCGEPTIGWDGFDERLAMDVQFLAAASRCATG